MKQNIPPSMFSSIIPSNIHTCTQTSLVKKLIIQEQNYWGNCARGVCILLHLAAYLPSGHGPDCDHLKPPTLSYFWVHFGLKIFCYGTESTENLVRKVRTLTTYRHQKCQLGMRQPHRYDLY